MYGRGRGEELKEKKLQLVWMPYKGCPNCPEPHYDLCSINKSPENIACISTTKIGAKLIRKCIRSYNLTELK